MTSLTTKRRKALRSTTFALPAQRKYPIPNRSHAANALARARAQGPSVYATVRRAVCRRYPTLPACKRKK